MRLIKIDSLPDKVEKSYEFFICLFCVTGSKIAIVNEVLRMDIQMSQMQYQ